MEKDDFLSDDLLKDLFSRKDWDSPGNDFTGKVMEQIVPAGNSFSLIHLMKSAWPWLLLGLVTFIFFMTSDLPYSDYIPGRGFLLKNLLPALGSMFYGLKPLVLTAKSISIPLMVIVAGTLLVCLDHLLFRKMGVRHQTSM